MTTTSAKPPSGGDSLAGAEYLANRELAAVAGFWFEFADELGRIQQRQFEGWLADVQHSAMRLSEADAPTEVVADHLQRRINHAMEGASEVSALWQRELERSISVHRRLWTPFLDMLSLPPR